MNSDQIKYFLEIAKCLNFSMAAEELNISQSSLSKHILNLEQEIGVPLFNRTTRKISLTPAGAEFLSYAKILMNDYSRLFAAMRKYMPRNIRTISLSSIPIMSIYKVTEMISAFNELHPEISVEIIEEDTIYVIQHLRERKVDIALTVTNTLNGSDLYSFPILDDEMVLIVNKKSRLANREIIDLREAADENFLFLGVETDMYNICYEKCLQAGFEPKMSNTRQTNMQIETIIDFVSKGRGVSIMMAAAASYYQNPNFCVVRLRESLMANLAILSRNEPLPHACRVFLDFAVDYYGHKNARLI